MDPNTPNFDPRVRVVEGSGSYAYYHPHSHPSHPHDPRMSARTTAMPVMINEAYGGGGAVVGGGGVYDNDPSSYYAEETTTTSGVYYHHTSTGAGIDTTQDPHAFQQSQSVAYHDMSAGASAWSPQSAATMTMNHPTSSGFYYPADDVPVLQLQQAHTVGMGGGIGGGDPITAVAYDDQYAAMYVATPSLSLLSRGGGRRAYNNDPKASMLVTHSTVDGTVYSSVAGHPEAPPQVLNAAYEVLYGFSTTTAAKTGSSQNIKPRHIPSHAYRPPYGSIDPATPTSSSNNKSASYQMGITSLLPCQGSGCGGFVSSVSPSSVRLHSCGGLLAAEAYQLQGMLCGTLHPNSLATHTAATNTAVSTTHVTVGGIAMASYLQQQHQQRSSSTATTTNSSASMSSSSLATSIHNNNKHHLHCLDLWRGLQIVASSTLNPRQGTTSTTTTTTTTNNSTSTNLAITSLATIHSHGGTVVAGCSDGQIRLFDGQRLREIAKVKSHAGGVVQVATSPDATFIAATGYGSRGNSYYNNSSVIGGGMGGGGGGLYSFPDASVLVYDIRYLGRGGIPHLFAGMRGGPRFLSFIPDVKDQPSNRLVVASGQPGGGLQIMVPYVEAVADPAGFILPQLDRDCITSMCVCEDNLALGTSQGTVLQYRLAGYSPSLELEGTSSISGLGVGGVGSFQSSSSPAGSVRSVGGRGNILPSSLVPAILPRKKELLEMPQFPPKAPPLSLEASLLLSEDKNARMGMTHQVKSIFSTYILSRDPTISPIGDANDPSTTSFGRLAASPMVPQSRLQVSSSLLDKATHAVDFLQTVPVSELNINLLDDHRPERIKARVNMDKNQPAAQPNPNKLLHTDKLYSLCYDEGLNRAKRNPRRHRYMAGGYGGNGGDSGSMEDSCLGADTIVIPQRYRLTLRPTHKSAASFNHQEFNETGFIPGWDYPPTMPNAFVPPVLMLFYFIPELRASVFNGQFLEKTSSMKSILPELGFLFHRVDSLGRFALLVPSTPGVSKQPTSPRVGAWGASNFISSLATMAEAEQLQILDGSPAAVDPPRRPEAFYRFLLYQVDKESGKLDSVKGMDFASINEFISGSVAPTQSVTRVMTVDLFYDGLGSEENAGHVRFGDILQRTLCRETRLRAWSQGSKSYETIVQRKIATSLPSVVSLSCACAGRKDEEGLRFWRGDGNSGYNWLPELIEIELVDTGGVIIREFVTSQGEVAGSWVECGNHNNFPPSVSDIVSNLAKEGSVRKCTYRLEALLSIVRDDFDRSSSEVLPLVEEGHLVLHARVRKDYKRRMIEEQVKQLQNLMHANSCDPLSLLGAVDDSWSERLEKARARLGALDSIGDNEWVIVNGFVVSNTVIEDVTSFHVKFKEPSLIVYRALDIDVDSSRQVDTLTVSPEVMKTLSLTNGSKSSLAANQRPSVLPGSGDLVAFDAEFVSLQEEEATLTETGSKVVVRETRYAVARISLIDCRTGAVVLDDHVLPREHVVDYLTRFSGIVPKDLDPKQSTHHLIGTRAAYLKLRYLMERGCIFVGHGLQQDFWTVNLAVPSSQIIDTVEIYHKPAQRYISLRFLTNFVLGRDMQQEVHDSVEDALAAYELYLKAVELKREKGKFEKLLDDLYEYGQKNDWKVMGVDDSD